MTGQPLSAPDGRDERWAAHREERRAQILDAAIAVIEATPEGEEIHVRQIAQQAGLGRAVVYRHFADKADLDRAVQRRILQMLVDTLSPEFELSGSIQDIAPVIADVVSTGMSRISCHHHVAPQIVFPIGFPRAGVRRAAGVACFRQRARHAVSRQARSHRGAGGGRR